MFADHLGSTHTVTNATGTPCYDASFTPYGQEVLNPNVNQTCPPNYKFTGYELDSETGNFYALARHYSPRLGRFLSPDPAGLAAVNPTHPQTWNRYSYVTNAPAELTDPLGLSTWCQIDGFTVDCSQIGILQSEGPGDLGQIGTWYAPGDCIENGDDCPPAIGPWQVAVPAQPGGQSVIGAFGKDVVRAAQLISKQDCANFLLSLERSALLLAAGVSEASQLSPGEEQLYNSLNPAAALFTASAAQAVQQPGLNPQQGGYQVNAVANYYAQPAQITFYAGFYAQNTTGQAQVLLHEAQHLIFPFTDVQLATAAGVPGAASMTTNQASAAFQNSLQQHCH